MPKYEERNYCLPMPEQPLEGRARPESLGLEFKPGGNHYRAYVGPTADDDLISAMVFNLLTCMGLRQHHRVMDIGCGSLRGGRLLIPYLNKRCYFGIEPNQWLVDDGVTNEVGNDLLRIKEPQFSFKNSMADFKESLELDFAVAQSIFSHCGRDLIEQWVSEVSFHLKSDGLLVATFLIDNNDYEGDGWIYPGCVKYRPESIEEIAHRHGIAFTLLGWFHPRQQWAVFSKPEFDRSASAHGQIFWNTRRFKAG